VASLALNAFLGYKLHQAREEKAMWKRASLTLDTDLIDHLAFHEETKYGG
jgi:hypothetical protein